MIRSVTVMFDFETETGDVTNVKTQVEGEVKKKTTTTRKKDVVKELEDRVLIVREEGKLIFNNRAMTDMNLEAGDRIVIKYEQGDKKLFPVIGTDLAFNEEGTGNKMTKSQTISYKGNQNMVLAEFGDEFYIKEYQDNIWKLIAVGETKVTESIEEAIEVAKTVEPLLLTDDEEVYDLDELTFKL